MTSPTTTPLTWTVVFDSPEKPIDVYYGPLKEQDGVLAHVKVIEYGAYEKLRAENEALEADRDYYKQDNEDMNRLLTANNERLQDYQLEMPELNEKITKLEAENLRLREALEFYADKNNWSFSYDMNGYEDHEQITNDSETLSPYMGYGGKRARKALAGGE